MSQPTQFVRAHYWALSTPDKGGCYTQLSKGLCFLSALGMAARFQLSVPTHGDTLLRQWPLDGITSQSGQSSLCPPRTAAGLAASSSQRTGDPGSPPLPGADRGTPRLYSFSCNTHTCSGSVQVCILKITTVWRQKESLFYD